MYADLVRTHVNLTVNCCVYETCPTDTSDVNLTSVQVLEVQALYLEWQIDLAVSQVFNDHILFTLILYLCPPDLFTSVIIDVKVVSYDNLRCFVFLLFLHHCCGFCGSCLRSFSCESELLLWNRSLLLLIDLFIQCI